MAEWAAKPIEYFAGGAQQDAVRELERYKGFTGCHFDVLARVSDPSRITERDIVAVSMLSVNVSPEASIRMLGFDSESIHERLRAIPTERPIWDDQADLSRGSPAWQLWELIEDNIKMGPTTTSKLLAAKRPHLMPIYDSVVAGALFKGSHVVHDYWDLWQSELRGPDGQALREAARTAQAAAEYDPDVSILRIIDIVVWMTERGSKQT